MDLRRNAHDKFPAEFAICDARRQRFPVDKQILGPFLNNGLKPPQNRGLGFSMAALPDQRRRAAHVAPVFVALGSVERRPPVCLIAPKLNKPTPSWSD